MRLRIPGAAMLLSFAAVALAQQQPTQQPIYGATYYYLTVTAGVGGQITSVPAGISCQASTCSSQYASGSFQLTASPLAGYKFTGWSGDCSGTGSCQVAMTADHSVTANFASTGGTTTTTTTGGAGTKPESGFWYNPDEGGRGYVIEAHDDDNLFIGGFMYDSNGNAVWYASGPGLMSDSVYSGQWQQYGGGQSLSGPFKPSTVTNPQVGSIRLQFLTTTSALLTLPDGRQITLARYPF